MILNVILPGYELLLPGLFLVMGCVGGLIAAKRQYFSTTQPFLVPLSLRMYQRLYVLLPFLHPIFPLICLLLLVTGASRRMGVGGWVFFLIPLPLSASTLVCLSLCVLANFKLK